MTLPAASRQVPAFDDWLPIVSPSYNWQWRYLQYAREQLDRVTRGEIKRLIIEMPPRHGKTDLATIRYSAYRIERDPRQRVIIGAYNQTLANKFSRKARRIVSSRMKLSDERNAAEDWETGKDGGLRAVGVGGGVTGQGGNLIIIDDPVKNREEAESLTYRDKVWDWYTNDLYTRLEPNAAIIVIMTRWHKDDLVGRILDSDDASNWTRIHLPAEAEADDQIGRSIGEALNPERYPIEVLRSIKVVLGRDYYALYQQAPQPREGGAFKESDLILVEAVPAEAQRVRWWDKGATEGDGDPTAGVLVAYTQFIVYIEDVVRGQWASGERDRMIRLTADKDAAQYGSGAVVQWSEQEPGSSGKDQAAAFVRLLAGHTVYTEPTTGSKEIAVDPLASQAQAGNVRVKRAAWTSAFISEACDFPSGQYDDQIEAAGRAFSKLALAFGESYSEVVNERQYTIGSGDF